MLTKILVGSCIALYLFVGFYSWISTVLEMTGRNPDDTYMGRLAGLSRDSGVGSVLTATYTFALWPVHLVLRNVLA